MIRIEIWIAMMLLMFLSGYVTRSFGYEALLSCMSVLTISWIATCIYKK